MRLSFILILSYFWCISAAAEQDPSIDDLLMEILELLREELPDGVDEVGVPPLDPFDLPDLNIPHIE